ncbi:MAG: efflux RND transporter periplasmic adaptor subunit [Dongiaceae bacterium]
MKRLGLLLILFGLIGAAAYYFHFEESGSDAAVVTDLPVAVEPVLAGDVVQKPIPIDIDTVGRVQAISTVAVRSRIDGVIESVEVADGQEVKAGEILFNLDDQEAQAELRTAEATLERDRSNLAIAQRDEERLQPLAAKDFASRQQLDQLAAATAAAKATVAADEAQLEAARIRLSYTVIRAPIDGRIGTIASKVGSSIRPNDVTALMTINQLQPIYVSFAIPQRHLGDLQDAMAKGTLPVIAKIPGREDEPQAGSVTFIENEVDPTTNTVSLKATFPNASDRLWPGQYVNVVVTLSVDEAAIVVPSDAVQISQDGSYVFVIHPDSTVELRPITVARTVGAETVVATGLQPGERVVTEGQLRLEPGSKVEIKAPVTTAVETAARP